MKDKNIDKLYREKLLNYEQQPPAHLLENVLAGIAAARRKRRIAFWRAVGVAAALILAFVAGWQFNYLNQESVQQPIVVSQNSSVETKNGSSVKTREGINANTEKETDADKIQEAKIAVHKSSGTTELGKSAQMANRITLSKENTESDRMLTARNDEFAMLQPLKTIILSIGTTDQSNSILHKRKLKSSVVEQPELSIDQQIIQQNQQQLQAQNETRKNARWLVGAQFSPEYTVNRSNHSSQYASEMLNSSSRKPVELGGGLSVEFKSGKRWSLQSGIYYAGLGQSSGNTSNSNNNLNSSGGKGSEYFNAPVNIETSKMMINSTAGVIQINGIPAGIVLGTNLEDKALTSAVVVSDARFIQNFQYIEIPLYLRYTVLDSRFDVELIGGVSSNVLVGNETFIESSSGKSLVGKTQDMQGLNYSGTFGLGLKYGLSKRIFLNVEPRIKYFLKSLNSNSEVTYKPYTFGVYTGISYQF